MTGNANTDHEHKSPWITDLPRTQKTSI